jgi:hypothetical protein
MPLKSVNKGLAINSITNQRGQSRKELYANES